MLSPLYFLTPRDCMEVQATVLMMSLMVQPLDKSLTGFRKPCMMGPIAMAPVDCCTACKVKMQRSLCRSEVLSSVAALQWRPLTSFYTL